MKKISYNPVPYEWYVKYGVRKYGFHGLSHQYITNRMEKILGYAGNLIIYTYIYSILEMVLQSVL